MNLRSNHKFTNILIKCPGTQLVYLALVYTALVSLSIINKQPWFDEGGYANPAYNLLNFGHLGMPILYSQLEIWPKFDYLTFHTPPLSFVFQAGWYALFDFGIYQMRALSAVFGLLLIFSTFFITRAIIKNNFVSFIAAMIVSTDYNIIIWASDGRMDIMCSSLGFTAIAVYLTLRKNHLNLAIISSQFLIVLSGLTHPAGILYIFSVWVLIFLHDAKNLRAFHLFALVPYVAGGLGWGLYVIQDTEAFKNQFLGNYGGNTRHNLFLSQPFFELKRYLSPAFGLGEESSKLSSLKVIQLVAYWGALVLTLFWKRLRLESNSSTLLVLIILHIMLMAILLSGTHLSYLVHIIPLYAIVLANVLWYFFKKTNYLKTITIFILGLLICLQSLGTITKYSIKNSPKSDYNNTVVFVNNIRKTDDLVVASSEFGFGFGFEGEVIDDYYLGTKGGFFGDIVIVGNSYKKLYDYLSESKPTEHKNIMTFLDEKYFHINKIGKYDIYISNR